MSDAPIFSLIPAFEAGDIRDKGIEQEYVARKVIGSTEFQNKKRVERSEYRKVLGIELIREIILK